MKKLICAEDVLKAKEAGGCIPVDVNTIVTPSAYDAARQHGVRFSEESSCRTRTGNEARSEPVLTKDEIYSILKKAIDRGVWNDENLEQFSSMMETGAQGDRSVPIGVSGRHIHLSQADIDVLFGRGYGLTQWKPLSQPGQFAAKEQVTVVGPKGAIEKVRILGPARKTTQAELLLGDSYKLGLSIPVRSSGDLQGSAPLTIIGPKGTVSLKEGAIVSRRHVHMNPIEAKQFGVRDGQIVTMRIDSERGAELKNVLVRVDENAALDFHIDTEEANAMGVGCGTRATLLP